MERRKIIRVPNGVAKKIAKDQKCGLTTVYAALNFTSNSESAKHIRQLATTIYGGVEDKKLYL